MYNILYIIFGKKKGGDEMSGGKKRGERERGRGREKGRMFVQ